MEETLIACEHLTKRFGLKAALDDVNLTIGRGRIVGLLGPNGSGKTTWIKILCGLLQPSSGQVLIAGNAPGRESKSIISYLPDRMYFADWMVAGDLMDYFEDFYADFDRGKAERMCASLGIQKQDRIKTMSKGTKEKLQLALVMCRQAQIYLLDEPIAGVDPAARDYILNTIINNYDENATILISTHLIADIENILDEVIFIQNGRIRLYSDVDSIRVNKRMSIDGYFREVFRC